MDRPWKRTGGRFPSHGNKVWGAWLLLLAAPGIWAHGLETATWSGTGPGFTAWHDDGGPAAGLAVQVFGPGDDRPFQEGFTDREGRFWFGPNRDGTWRYVVEDGVGHRAEGTVTWSGGRVKGPEARGPRDRPGRLVFGIGVILALFGTWAVLRTSRPRDAV